MINIHVPGEPLPKARPRVTKRHAYTPARTRAWEETVSTYARQAVSEPLRGPLLVAIKFIRSTRRRVDLDNLIKAALDGLNGIAWEDDSQIHHLIAWLEYGKEPGLYVAACEIERR